MNLKNGSLLYLKPNRLLLSCTCGLVKKCPRFPRIGNSPASWLSFAVIARLCLPAMGMSLISPTLALKPREDIPYPEGLRVMLEHTKRFEDAYVKNKTSAGGGSSSGGKIFAIM